MIILLVSIDNCWLLHKTLKRFKTLRISKVGMVSGYEYYGSISDGLVSPRAWHARRWADHIILSLLRDFVRVWTPWDEQRPLMRTGTMKVVLMSKSDEMIVPTYIPPLYGVLADNNIYVSKKKG